MRKYLKALNVLVIAYCSTCVHRKLETRWPVCDVCANIMFYVVSDPACVGALNPRANKMTKIIIAAWAPSKWHRRQLRGQ